MTPRIPWSTIAMLPLAALAVAACGSGSDEGPSNEAGAGGSGASSAGTGAVGGAGGATAGTGGATGGSGGTSSGGTGGAPGGTGGAPGGSGGTGPDGSGGTSPGGTGGTGPDGSGGSAGGTGTCTQDTTTHTGDGTYYDFADGSGACMFPATPNDLMVGAMNLTDFAAAAVCGTCAHVVGPSGEVKIRIVDLCPECKPGDIDLSPQAFQQIADLALGRVTINWQYVPCDVQGPLVYHFKDGSNQWWTAVQVRNHRYQVAKFEYQDENGTFQEVQRVDYNFFVQSGPGMGPGPYTFRVTDIYGQVVTDTGIPGGLDNADAPGAGQFPLCAN